MIKNSPNINPYWWCYFATVDIHFLSPFCTTCIAKHVHYCPIWLTLHPPVDTKSTDLEIKNIKWNRSHFETQPGYLVLIVTESLPRQTSHNTCTLQCYPGSSSNWCQVLATIHPPHFQTWTGGSSWPQPLSPLGCSWGLVRRFWWHPLIPTWDSTSMLFCPGHPQGGLLIHPNSYPDHMGPTD